MVCYRCLISKYSTLIGHSHLSGCVRCTPLGNNEQLLHKVYKTSVDYCFIVIPNLEFQSIRLVYCFEDREKTAARNKVLRPVMVVQR